MDIIWQPTPLYQPHHDFEILLNRQFAGEMLETRLSTKDQNRMNELGSDVTRRLKYPGSHPYIFHKSTAFVSQITLNGTRGTWLESENIFGKAPDSSKEKPIRYTTHNSDSLFDISGLLSLFDLWISYSDTLKELDR